MIPSCVSILIFLLIIPREIWAQEQTNRHEDIPLVEDEEELERKSQINLRRQRVESQTPLEFQFDFGISESSVTKQKIRRLLNMPENLSDWDYELFEYDEKFKLTPQDLKSGKRTDGGINMRENIRDNFILSYSNNDFDFSSAQIYLIGDTHHGDFDQEERRRRIISQITYEFPSRPQLHHDNSTSSKWQNVILFESLGSNYDPSDFKNLQFQSQFYGGHLAMGGWDHIEVKSRAINLMFEMNRINQEISTLRKKILNYKNKNTNETDSELIEMKNQHLELKRKYDIYIKEFLKAKAMRDLNMTDTIVHILEKFPSARIFIIAGDTHFQRSINDGQSYRNIIFDYLGLSQIPFIHFKTKMSEKLSLLDANRNYTKFMHQNPKYLKNCTAPPMALLDHLRIYENFEKVLQELKSLQVHF